MNLFFRCLENLGHLGSKLMRNKILFISIDDRFHEVYSPKEGQFLGLTQLNLAQSKLTLPKLILLTSCYTCSLLDLDED